MTKFTSDKQEHQTKQKQEGKQLNLLSLEQELDINECLFNKNFKQPTRIAPCSMLDRFRFIQWSRHLEKNHTKLTNAGSKNY
jgi:hypothetical protein